MTTPDPSPSSEPRRPGPKTILTPEVQEKICQALAVGNSRKDAAHYAGVDDRTVRRWLVAGAKDPETIQGEFRRAVLDAEARAKMAAQGCIARAIREGDWKAAAWWLSRKYPQEFAERSVLFLLGKALEAMQTAADEAGRPLDESAWDAAWAKLADQFAKNLPCTNGHGLAGPAKVEEGFDSEEDLKVALRLLGLPSGPTPNREQGRDGATPN